MSVTEDRCPICLEDYNLELTNLRLKDGINNSDLVSTCIHYFCTECIQQLYNDGDTRCPICREDLEDWMEDNYG